jgi:DNA-binding response OmpR family regulator
VSGGGPIRRVLVVADDLIWSSRLVDQVRLAGAEALPARSMDALRDSLTGAARPGAEARGGTPPPAAGLPAAAIVDLTARAYDAIEACRLAAEAGLPVLAIGQHDDQVLRRRALGAGADRVLAYRKMATDGASVIARWLTGDRSPDPGRRPGAPGAQER